MQLTTQECYALLRLVLIGPQVLLLSAGAALGQDPALQAHSIVSQETYSHVLDLVFPRALSTSLKVDFAFALRFEPSTHPESQIVIVAKHGGGVEVTRYSPEGGNVFARLNASLAQGARENASEMARLIRAERTLIPVPDGQVRQWQSMFFADVLSSISDLRKASERYQKPNGEQEVVLDGTHYELWYAQGDSELSWHRLDVEIDNPDSPGFYGIVKWMNAVRVYVERAAEREPPAMTR